MKILTVSDLHQRRHLYEQLAAAVAEHKPDLICVVGDWLETGDGAYMTPAEAAEMLSRAACGREVAFVPGNHELFEVEMMEFRRAWRNIRTLRLLDRSVWQFGRLVVVGFPIFACDAWESWLPTYMSLLGPAGRLLWLMHEPPVEALGEPFFVCEDWRRAIERFQPLIVISGHDHNKPLDTGVWKCQVGKTTCVNVGQRAHTPGGTLCYCTFRIELGVECGVGGGYGSPQLLDLRRHG